MDITQEVITLLQDTGYSIKESFDAMSSLYFEDSTIIGFVSVQPSFEDIVHKWKEQQSEFLRRNAARLRRSPIKAWNAYSIFLTGDSCDGPQSASLISIEEDFQATRKIARADILTREDVERALYPILPIQNLATVSLTDPLNRLWSRLEASQNIQLALTGTGSAGDLADVLTSEQK